MLQVRSPRPRLSCDLQEPFDTRSRPTGGNSAVPQRWQCRARMAELESSVSSCSPRYEMDQSNCPVDLAGIQVKQGLKSRFREISKRVFYTHAYPDICFQLDRADKSSSNAQQLRCGQPLQFARAGLNGRFKPDRRHRSLGETNV